MLPSKLCCHILNGEPRCRYYELQTNLTLIRYDPIQKYGPQDCVASINAIIAKIDKLTDSHNTQAINELKAIFGLENLKDIRDFAMTIAFPSESSTNNCDVAHAHDW